MKIKNVIGNIFWSCLFSIFIAAYIQNLVFVLNIQNFYMKMGEDLISIIGCFVPPVGIIHTFYVWYYYVL